MALNSNPKGSRATKKDDYRCLNARKTNQKKFPNGFIYFLRIAGHDLYKIGASHNPERRIRDISSAMPFNIEVIKMQHFDSIYEIETSLHDEIKDHYVKSEWFMLTPEKAAEILNKIEQKNIKIIEHQYLIAV